jgi:hypothetical protein
VVCIVLVEVGCLLIINNAEKQAEGIAQHKHELRRQGKS